MKADAGPLRLLLVSDDGEFVAHMTGCAAARGLEVAYIGPEDDAELPAFRHGANVVVFDADGAPRARMRAASAFANAHRGVTVVLATATPDTAKGGRLPLVEKRSAEEILRDIDHVRRGDGR